MKAVIVMGSRNLEGQTARAAKAFAQGFAAKGGDNEFIYLPQLTIERCRQCNDNGWGICRTHGTCVIEDHFPVVVASIADADVVVFATPVYFSDLSESLRAFLDRLRRTCTHEAGKSSVRGKPAIGICVAGGGGGGAPHCTASLTKVLSTCGFDCVDMIPVRRQNLEMKLEMLKAAGEWLASQGSCGADP
jgi:multimeric flavodoxin WrbA